MGFEDWLYDPDGNKISESEWRAMRANFGLIHVDYTRNGEVEVSTVWTGVSDEDPPRIYETGVFRTNRQIRRITHVTRADAEKEHRRMVKEWLGN